MSDNSGVLYISDTNGAKIRALTVATSNVTTFAGNGTQGYVDGGGGPGGPARIHRPRGITSDGTSIYWVEFNAHSVRQGVLATLDVSTLAGAVTTCTGAGTCSGLMCRGGVCLPAGAGPVGGGYLEGVGILAQFQGPFSVAYHFPSNSIFVVDGANDVIRRIR